MIEGGTIVPMDRARTIIGDGRILVENGRVTAVGSRSEINPRSPDRVIDASGMAIIPGLVNLHTHTSEKFVAGLVDDLNLYTWLERVINPMMVNLTRDDCYWTSLLAQVEMIKSGITCYLDHFDTTIDSIFETLLDSVKASGMRGVVSREIFTNDDVPDKFMLEGYNEIDEKMIADTVRHARGGRDSESRSSVRLGLGGVSYASDSLITRIRSIANELNIGIHVHAAESLDETRYLKRKMGTTPIRRAYKMGLLGPDIVLAHCVWVDSDEIKILAETDSKVAYNPVSNMKLADGVAPIWKMIQEGVTVGIGTDGTASNDNLDFYACMKNGAYLQKVHAMNPSHLQSYKILEMATIDGARSLQLEDQIGSIEVGKKADLTLLNLRTPNMTPTNDVVRQIVCSCTPSNVDTVLIDGEVVLENRRFVTLDESKTIREGGRRAAELVARMYS